MGKKLILSFLLFSFLSTHQGHAMDQDEDETSKEQKSLRKRKIQSLESSQPQKTDTSSKKKPVAKEDVGSKMAQISEVELTPGKGTKNSGGGLGGQYWNIFYNEKGAGKVFINLINQPPLGEHPSLQIFLNKTSQGKHIGRIAYEKACELSKYDTIYAYMSKKNLPSIKAAAAAGFIQVFADTTRQMLMQWTRKKKVM